MAKHYNIPFQSIFEENGIRYLVIAEDAVRVTCITDSEHETVRIPEVVADHVVAEIDQSVSMPFNVRTVEIPLSVKEIKVGAFAIRRLKKVYFYKPEILSANDTISFPKDMFYFCEDLEEVSAEIETNLEIGMNAFYCCYKLKSLENFVIDMSVSAFFGDTKITELTIADNARLYGDFFRFHNERTTVTFKGNFRWQRQYGLKGCKLRIHRTSNLMELKNKEDWNIEVIA